MLWHVQLYEPFDKDFGPLNLGLAYRFCQRMNHLLEVGAMS
jgi:Dual specificity protein phosphatase, N-terminal half